MNIWLTQKDGKYQTVVSKYRPHDAGKVICKIGDAINQYGPSFEYRYVVWTSVLTGINITENGTKVTLDLISANGLNFVVPLEDCARVFFFNSLVAWYIKTRYVQNNQPMVYRDPQDGENKDFPNDRKFK